MGLSINLCKLLLKILTILFFSGFLKVDYYDWKKSMQVNSINTNSFHQNKRLPAFGMHVEIHPNITNLGFRLEDLLEATKPTLERLYGDDMGLELSSKLFKDTNIHHLMIKLRAKLPFKIRTGWFSKSNVVEANIRVKTNPKKIKTQEQVVAYVQHIFNNNKKIQAAMAKLNAQRPVGRLILVKG